MSRRSWQIGVGGLLIGLLTCVLLLYRSSPVEDKSAISSIVGSGQPAVSIAASELDRSESARAAAAPTEKGTHEPVSTAPGEGVGWWSDEGRLQRLRERWFEVHAWNVQARVAEFEAKKAGTAFLKDSLEYSGNLLEDIPLDPADFAFVLEHEKAGIGEVVQITATRRMRYGKSPFSTLDEAHQSALRSEVLQSPLHFPSNYLPDALNLPYETLSGTQRTDLAKLRIEYLKRLAPYKADQKDRQTSALHLLGPEDLLQEYRSGPELTYLDPTYPDLLQRMSMLEAEYRDAVIALLSK